MVGRTVFSNCYLTKYLNLFLLTCFAVFVFRITRNLDGFGPKVHCFSSHFFTTLIDEGPRGVQKWTAKKGINIFEKKFVFIPVNETLHWSLCVVVNPGYIENRGEDDHVACLLFLDSLKAHRKSKVYNKVVGWLNEEWKRVKGRGDEPFRKKDFPLLDPKSTFRHTAVKGFVQLCFLGSSDRGSHHFIWS